AERRVELYAEAAVDLHLPFVVNPRNAEDDLPFRLADQLDHRILQIARKFGDNPTETLQNLSDSLLELLFACIAPHDFLQDRFELLINIDHFPGVSIQREHNKRASAAALTKESAMLNRNFHHIEHFPGT